MSDTSSEAVLLADASRHLLGNYRQAPMVLARGQGCLVFDLSGKRYLDFAAGVAVSALGHNHPEMVATIQQQAAKLIHVSNYFYNEENVRLATELCKTTGYDRAFFCNSGTEAIEAMLKLARRYFFTKNESKRVRVIAFDNAFHGRTLGALTLTGTPKYREGFGPLPGGVTHVPYGDLGSVERALGDDLAAILVEPVQGEGGVMPAPAGFLRSLRDLSRRAGALLLADEIQTGMGRTGTLLGQEQDGVRADAITLAKGLGGGVPIGALLMREELAGALTPGTHGSTFGGGALASSVARTVLRIVSDPAMLERIRSTGEHLRKRLTDLVSRNSRVLEGERGRGLLRGTILREGIDPRAVLGAIREHGVLLTIAGSRVLRFTPPLIVTPAEIDEAVDLVGRALPAFGA